MTKLTLISNQNQPLQPVVETALANELRLLEAGIQQAEQRLKEFEQTYHLTTEDFITQYENDALEETLEFAEWIGEHRVLTRLQDKATTIRDIELAH